MIGHLLRARTDLILHHHRFLVARCFATHPELQVNPNVSVRKIQRLLIANRGEIACRIIRTARRLGIETVAVFSDADRNSMHVAMADQTFHIGPSPASESYLIKEKLLDVAQKSQSDAIHPGYGFLSENFEFANLCVENGIRFVGPSAESIKSMGIKSLSKSIMINASVPVIPGFHDDNQQENEKLFEEAKKIGFPVMIKAVRGGGGKGMRIAHNEAEFFSQLDSARREAMKSFGDDVVLLEKFVHRPRHIEVQVFGDQHGNCVHLFERDCSSQRRHQKVIEEAPAPHITHEIRHELGSAAVKAAMAVNYCGAGTVEFIFDTQDKKFYFMEMNTRLQVEHPITEMVTGLDLVEWQLRVASGEPLPQSQSAFQTPRGHAFEARIYAEDADANFMPCTGVIEALALPDVTNEQEIRIETGVRSGDQVSVFYDPMIAKLVVWAPDRQASLDKLIHSLHQYRIAGFKTNVDYLIRLASHPQFQAGTIYTDFIAEHSDELKRAACTDSVEVSRIQSVAALALALKESSDQAYERQGKSNDVNSPFDQLGAQWISGTSGIIHPQRVFRLRNTYGLENELTSDITIELRGGSRYAVNVSTGEVVQSFEVEANFDATTGQLELTFVRDGNFRRFQVLTHGERAVTVFDKHYGALAFEMELPEFLQSSRHSENGPSSFDGRSIISPMPAVIEKISVKAGDTVRHGDPIVILTAMKMEHVICATLEPDQQRVVEQVFYKPGDSVAKGTKIVQFTE